MFIYKKSSQRLCSGFLRVAIFTVATFFAANAPAFVPSSRTILTRLAHNNGKGFYAIEQEVQFKTEADPIVLRERWIVENGASMRLSVSGLKGSQGGWRYDAYYKDGKRHWTDGQGLRTSQESSEFVEPVLYFRGLVGMTGWLTKNHLIPAGMGRERHFSPKTPYEPEPGLRLARSGGVVAYAFGAPTPVDDAALPGFWVDQDAFQLRRLRFPSQAEVQADKHATFAGGLRLPRERTVTWDNNSVLIRVLKVKGLSNSAGEQALGTIGSLVSDGRAAAARLPEAAQVREFYSRFR